ncbi:uncharacterized protein LOC132041899 [Lycium ferocissimum]|uniref:uncharacterized protein LOC132041899 n=1 Tax=Lycium ferocissimum TaxID=112874 RepID=UPI0028156E6C|nr:uncharacterized protein LOC132041899 [Lycium ferocissimum]
MAISSNKTLPDLSKLEPLDRNNFKRWSQKLLIFFEQLEVDYVLFDEPPVDVPNIVTDVSNPTGGSSAAAVRGHLLNHMTNPLFDLFVTNKSAKEIWDSLEKIYDTDNAGKKKDVVGKWIKFQMVDNKPIMEQVHEYENLTATVLTEGMKMCEVFQANVLLEKFPPSWSDYRNQLKHKKKDLTLQVLISHMRTEEANRLKDKIEALSLNSPKANLMETSGIVVKDRFKGK